MATLVTCPQGHQWDPAKHRACPKCGAAASPRVAGAESSKPRNPAQETRAEQQTQPPHSQPQSPKGAEGGATRAQPPAPNPQPPASIPLTGRFGKYQIVKELGHGGMGTVYLAHDTQLDRKVALKVPHFSPQDVQKMERFFREARAAATIEHPNICPVHEVGEINGVHYLIMAFIEGRSLADSVDPDKPMAPRQVALLVRKLAVALHEAHAKGVIHRDLKPANVMVNHRGEPVIMDFGLARRAVQGELRLTQSGAMMGTPAYMPPEQVKGDLEAMGPQSDIYSLGVILYELLTGHLPFEGPVALVLGQIMTQPPPPPSKLRSDVDPDLERVCLKAMAKEIKDRYRSMAEFANALGEYVKATTMTANPAAAVFADLGARPRLAALQVPRGRKPIPRWALISAAGALVALVLVGTVIYVSTDTGTIKIELLNAPPGVEVKVDGDTIDIRGLDEPLKLRAGKHDMVVTGKNFETVSKSFTVKRGENPVLRVTMEPKTMAKVEPPAKKPSREDVAKVEALLADASSFIQNNKFGEAVAACTEALRLDPHSAKAYRLRGTAYLHSDLPQAIKDFSEALKLDPQDAESYARRSFAYLNTGQYDACIDDCNAVLRHKPDPTFTLTAYANRGTAFYYKKDNISAIADLDKAIELDPETGIYYVFRGLSHIGRGDAAKAKADRDAALKRDKTLADNSRFRRLHEAVETAAKPAFTWPADALKEGRIPAPDLSKAKVLFKDEFDDPKSGALVSSKGDYWEAGYDAGKGFLRVGPKSHRTQASQNLPPLTDFACEVVGRVTGPGGWGLGIGKDVKNDSLAIAVRSDGKLVIELPIFPAERTIGPLPHRAIKTGDKFNTLLAVVRGQRLEIYINGVAVCDPIFVDEAVTPARLWFDAFDLGNGNQAEFERLTVWSADGLPTPEERLKTLGLKPAFTWPADALKEGRIPAPDLTKARALLKEEFADRKGALPTEPANGIERSFRDGRYCLKRIQAGSPVSRSKWAVAETACSVTARVVGEDSDRWAIEFNNWNLSQGVHVGITHKGELAIGRTFKGANPPRFPGIHGEPIRHPAIKSGDASNTLLVVTRGRQLEFYVNGVAVCDPLTVDFDFLPCVLDLYVSGRPGVRAEFERINIWSAEGLPTPEERTKGLK